MSFVGPRPDVPGYADNLKGDDMLILKSRPGITGPASLKYRNEETILAGVSDPEKYNDEVIFPDEDKSLLLSSSFFSERSSDDYMYGVGEENEI